MGSQEAKQHLDVQWPKDPPDDFWKVPMYGNIGEVLGRWSSVGGFGLPGQECLSMTPEG